MISTKNKKKILRIAPFPTLEESGRGLHPYEISKSDNCETFYLTFFKKNATPFEKSKNIKLFTGSFYTTPYPKNKNIFYKGLFSVYRLIKVLSFSFYGVFIMLRNNVDIVHIHSPMFFLVCLFGKLFGKKILLLFMN